MSYCRNCGKQVVDHAIFCDGCGTKIKVEQNFDNNSEAGNGSERKTVYEGQIHKCPRCGEILDSFVTVCPLCNHEIRSNEASGLLKDFQEKLEALDKEGEGYKYRYLGDYNEEAGRSKNQKKIELIKNYPIPNNKEDIREFMILASSNFDANVYNKNLDVEDVSDSWLAKIEQCYQKAKMSFPPADFAPIEEIYLSVIKKINDQTNSTKSSDCVASKQSDELSNDKKEKQTQLTKDIEKAIPNIVIVSGWLISLIILIIVTAVNSLNSTASILFIMVTLAGCFFVPQVTNCENIIPKLVVSSGMILIVMIMIILCSDESDLGVMLFLCAPMIVFLFARMYKNK